MPELKKIQLTDDVEISAYIADRDFSGRPLIAIPDSGEVEKVYRDTLIKFWRDLRSRENTSPSLRQQIMTQQQPDYSAGTKRTLSRFLEEAVNEIRNAGKSEISILELGCANGCTLRHFARHFPDITVNFFGIELTDFLVDHLLTRFPTANAIAGGADEFIKMTAEDFGREHFDVFLASGVLCQISPSAADAVLAHAAAYCDEVMIWDYLMNFDGEVSKDDAIIFKLTERSKHLLFLTPYRDMFHEAGFSEVEIEYAPVTGPECGPVEGSVRARKSHSLKHHL